MRNWCPNSLLCTYYKILAKVLTNRLKLVLSSVISPPQTCGVPGRFSGEHVRLLQDIVNFSNTDNVGAAILSLGQEKAFDRVDWSFSVEGLGTYEFFVHLFVPGYEHFFSCISEWVHQQRL